MSENLDQLEIAANCLLHYIRCARGEDEDITGVGLWNIAISNLEYGADVKVIPKDLYNRFLDKIEKKLGTNYD